MPKGPLGGPRPFAEYRVVIDPHEMDVEVEKVGPLGITRPFAKNNPDVAQDRINECALSDAGIAFGAKRRGIDIDSAPELNQVPPDVRKDIIEDAEKWCEGVLEATAVEELEEGEATELIDSFDRQTSAQDTVEAETEDETETEDTSPQQLEG